MYEIKGGPLLSFMKLFSLKCKHLFCNFLSVLSKPKALNAEHDHPLSLTLPVASAIHFIKDVF